MLVVHEASVLTAGSQAEWSASVLQSTAQPQNASTKRKSSRRYKLKGMIHWTFNNAESTVYIIYHRF